MTPRLSVVVPTTGRPVWRRCVTSVAASLAATGQPGECVLVWQGEAAAPSVHDVDLPSGVALHVLDRLLVSSSWARNEGLVASTGDVVAFVDDDEVADPGWAAELLAAFGRAPRPAGVFGPVRPLDDAGIPHNRFDGDRPVDHRGAVLPWLVGTGGNMAFDRRVLLQLRGLDVAYGIGAPADAAEDTELMHRLLRAGHLLRWAPGAVVLHPTKTAAERLASRRPYGRGVGVLVRRQHSVPLAARYGAKVARAYAAAVVRGDARGRQEALQTASGFLDGGLRRRVAAPPRLQPGRVPAAVRAVIDLGSLQPVPSSPSALPHLVWLAGERVLHAYAGEVGRRTAAHDVRAALHAAGVPQVPRTDAVAVERGVLWVVEERMHGRPWRPTPVDWEAAVAWQQALAACGPLFPSAPQERRQRLAAVVQWAGCELGERAAAALRDDVEAVLALPAVPVHHDFAPKNLLLGAAGLVPLDWEFAHAAGSPGQDLLLLYAMRAGEPADVDSVRKLVRKPAGSPLTEPLWRLGVLPELVPALVRVTVVGWAMSQAARRAAPGLQGGGTQHQYLAGDLLSSE